MDPSELLDHPFATDARSGALEVPHDRMLERGRQCVVVVPHRESTIRSVPPLEILRTAARARFQSDERMRNFERRRRRKATGTCRVALADLARSAYLAKDEACLSR